MLQLCLFIEIQILSDFRSSLLIDVLVLGYDHGVGEFIEGLNKEISVRFQFYFFEGS